MDDATPVTLEPHALGREGMGSGGRKLVALCRALAIAGGLVFVGLVGMELVSIVGRKLFSWTVPGDVEILQMAAAFASASFFAYCHMVRGDVKVDFFTHNLAPPKVALLDAAGGPEEFLERYAVILCSDHGQTRVEGSAQLQSALANVP